jgi:DNA-binding NtrC family response regulator
MDKLLLVDDEADVLYSFRRILTSPDLEIVTASSGEEALKLVGRVKPDLVIMDVRMGGLNGLETLRRLRQSDARLPVILMTAYGTTQTAIEAMKLGAYDYVLKPFDVPRLKETIAGALAASRAMKQVVSYEPLLESEDYALGIVGRTEAMQNVFKLIGQLAASDATALITGESGTGKELVARAIYHHSRRAGQSFLAINCAAIPEALLESELFGHEKASFTGATAQRIGKFEQCNQGTIFLDEIGDMSLPTQTKILRVLQSGAFERVGGNETVQVDVRVIAATNKPLEQAVAAKQFREDLFFRLNVVRIHLPPLRERRADIPLLVNYFLQKLAEREQQPPKSISPEALALLDRHEWPGNVRELQNVIQRALVMAKGPTLLPGDFPAEGSGGPSDAVRAPQPVPLQAGESGLPHGTSGVGGPGVPVAGSARGGPGEITALGQALFEWARREPGRQVLPAVERELVVQALLETKGNQVQAARLLGITRATLRKRIEKFGIRQEVSIR